MTDTVKTTEDYTDLIGDIKDHLNAHLTENITAMLSSADTELFDMAENAESNEDQTTCFELMKQLRNIRNILSSNFIKKIDEYLRPYTAGTPESSAPIGGIEELSLVAQEDMEDMVLIKSMGTQATSAYREKLSHLEKRFEELALKTPEIFEKNALNPINFCQAFNDSLGIIFDLRSKKILFKFFETYTISTLGTVFDDINQMMIDTGILPEIKLSSGTTSSARRPAKKPNSNQPSSEQDNNSASTEAYSDNSAGNNPMGASSGSGATSSPTSGQISGAESTMGSSPFGQNAGTSASTNDSGTPQGPQSHGGYAMTAAPGMSPYNEQSVAGHNAGENSSQNANTPANSTNTGTNTAESSSGEHQSNYHHQTAGMPASQVDNVLSNYFGSPISSGTPSSTDETSVAGQTTGNAQYLGHTEILNALSDVQQQPEYINPEELKFDSSAIKQAVLSNIAKQSGGIVSKRINQIAEKTIDFIEMIFDAIIDDDNISDTIKTLLLRLQIPVIKASMLDQEFFIYDDHPARVLLDKITETGIGIATRDNEIYTTLDEIVHTLVSEYDLHTSTFQTALDSLNKFINRRERIAREKEEAEQQKVLKEHARNTVLKTLRSVTKEKRLPESVHALVLRRWPTLLFNHYVDFGKENDAWIHIVEILRDIIESIQPPESAEDLARMNANRDELTKLAREYLSRTNQSKKDLDSVIADLEATYDAIDEAANFEPEQTESAAQIITNESPQEKANLPEVESSPKQVLPPNVMPGMWFKVHTGEDSRPRRCKLSVIIVEDSNLVFVNYAGEVIIEKSFDQFSEELELYQSKIIMGHSVFDHALNSVITNIGNS